MARLERVIFLGLSGGVGGAGTRNWDRDVAWGGWRDGDAFC